MAALFIEFPQHLGVGQLWYQGVLDRVARRVDAHSGEHVGEERIDQQALRGVAIQAARQHIKQHVGVEAAGGGAVRALDLVGVDLELRRESISRSARAAGRAGTAANRLSTRPRRPPPCC